MQHRESLHKVQIYRLKLVVVGLLLALSGVLISVGGDWLDTNGLASHLILSILRGLSDVFLVAGAIGIAMDLLTGRSKDEADSARTRTAVKELAPDFTDAVVRGFAAAPDDLKRVATPALLDDLATNALGLRLGDAAFAREIYTDLRDNAIRAPERWHDVDVRIRLSSIDERSTVGAPRSAVPAFAVTVTWEYTVVPSHSVKKFACTSDRDEFHELVSDIPSTSTWFMTLRPGVNAGDRASFELLQFSVDGEDRKIRRTTRKSGQTYSVVIGDDIVRQQKPVRIRHVYRTIVAKDVHRIFLAIAQPTKGLSLTMDYSDADIAAMSVSDLISSSQRPRVARLPEHTTAREVSLEVPGWVLPQAQVTFVWTLADERRSSGVEELTLDRTA